MDPVLSRPKTQVKHKKNPTRIGYFEVLSKTQVNTKSPQSQNLNLTLIELCYFIEKTADLVLTVFEFYLSLSPTE
jgi:hypothetical protein